MTTSPASASASGQTPVAAVRHMIARLERIPLATATLVARISVAAIFWQSGRTKMEGWQLSESAVVLFQEDYRLPLLDPLVAAWLATVAEHVLPALLVLGLASRFAALGLLAMTATIQLFVYPAAWPTHGVWAACLLLVLLRGPGPLSLDRLIAGLAGR